MKTKYVMAFLACSMAACGANGGGTLVFTTWGEAFVENEIPADPTGQNGFIDGWRVKFDSFLVSLQNLDVRNASGEVGASSPQSFLLDNVRPGVKPLIAFADVPAKAWNRVSFHVAPVRGDSELVGATETDKAAMLANGHSVFVRGTAVKTDAAGAVMQKQFRWGFALSTQYSLCTQPQPVGPAIEGVVVTEGATDNLEITTHGDHLFYDRLRESTLPTALRFDAIAAADANADGDVTLQELDTVPLNVQVYDPSGLPVSTLGQFVTALVRSIPHFRGEGECAITPL